MSQKRSGMKECFWYLQDAKDYMFIYRWSDQLEVVDYLDLNLVGYVNFKDFTFHGRMKNNS